MDHPTSVGQADSADAHRLAMQGVATKPHDGALNGIEPGGRGVELNGSGQLASYDQDLHGLVAVVTGAGSIGHGIGIGRATAITLARRGASLALVDVEADRHDYTLDCIARCGGDALPITADVTQPSDCGAAVASAVERFGRIDILVNNVGIIGPSGDAASVDLAALDKAMQINVTSMIAMSQAAIPAMLSPKVGRPYGGSVVNVSSVSGLRGGHPNVLYPASKAAVIGLTRAMAVHHGRQNVRVNCVAPGMIHTPMVEVRGVDDTARRARANANLLGTEGDAWDVANAIAFLVGPAARWITGVVLPVDAGLSAGDVRKPSPS